jgi:rhodanese-related sulfurtransferase
MNIELFEKLRQKKMLEKSKEFFEHKLDFLIGPVELDSMLKRGGKVNIIDVRAAEDYKEGHIPGAISLPKEQWSTFKGLSKDRPNVFYCYSIVCQIATKAAKYFAEHEFPVIELQGGFDEWQKHNLPIEK